MATWWTSDTHFSHRNIIKYASRPFADVDEMNAELISRWNARVAPDDVVWHLGDLALGHNIERQVLMTGALNGRRRLVPGNHDRVASFFEGGDQRIRFLPIYEAAGWEIQPEQFEHDIDGYPVMVCHFPYRGDSLDSGDRYTADRPRDAGLPILHGHVHTDFAVQGRQFNVGVDVHDYAPVHQDEILGWLRSLTPPGAGGGTLG